MQPLPEAIARIEALQQALVDLDPPAAAMLARHVHAVREVATVLREVGIEMAIPGPQRRVNFGLRDRIDALLGIVPRAMPISQEDGS